MVRDAPEITLSAYKDQGGRVGTIDIFIEQREGQWIGTFCLKQEGQKDAVLAEGEYLADSHEESLDAAVLLANDLLNQRGLFAEL